MYGNFAGVAQLVERNLAKVDVAGSSPVSRSKEPVLIFETGFSFGAVRFDPRTDVN